MIRVFSALLAALTVMSVVAWMWYPRPPDDGKVHLQITLSENHSTREQAETFNSANPGIFLHLDNEDSADVKTIVQSLAGVGPDLFTCHSPASLDAYVRAGIAMDLTDEIREMGIEPARDLWNGADTTFRYHDGRLYGMPLNVAVDCLWYHADLAKRAGVEIPEHGMTWGDFINIGKRLTIRTADGRISQYAFALDWQRWLMFVRQWNGEYFSADGTRCMLDSPEAIAAIQFMHDLVYLHELSPSPLAEAAMASQGGWGSNSLIPQFGSKRVVSALGGRWWLIVLRNYENLDLGLAVGPFAQRQTYISYGKSVMVNRQGRNIPEALRFVRFLASDAFHEIIHRHADGFGSRRSWAYSRETLDDAARPKEKWNKVWRDTMELAEPESSSPFVNSFVARRIVTDQLDLVRNGLKSPSDAMREAAKQINEDISRNLAAREDLRDLYRERTGKEWTIHGQ